MTNCRTPPGCMPIRPSSNPGMTRFRDTSPSRILIGVGVLALAAVTAVFLYRDQIGMMIAFGRLKPERSFAEAPPPAAPDYSLGTNWAALPDRPDDADVLPGGDFATRS